MSNHTHDCEECGGDLRAVGCTCEKKTNIGEDDKLIFSYLKNGGEGMALVSCFYEGKPASVIALVEPKDDDTCEITPIYLRITNEMADRLIDHDGDVPE
ncbi:unnamed protein product [marine sediment metagenome]|uniref:Uncharacterized protein n=1 Tax=marine sediment metagenome TaxID=412755 RepID=X0RJ79_9ZZZZ